ncbi:MAG TPA: apolipoprotein N-acyltransferase [Methylocystis sp.]|nr:apolipoprotein N-acyltransferase [Methylocystis sp.]
MHATIDLEATAPALSLPQRIILSEGWMRRAIACAAGACGALALEPINFLPAMAVTLTVAVWLIDGSADARGERLRLGCLRSAMADGWWLGFGYFVAGLWWLGGALLVDADQFAWALPLAEIGAPAGLALFPALGFGVARALWSPGSARVLALAAGLGGAEWLRGHVLTGFPWNDIGMALASVPALAQSAALVGANGLDLCAVVIFAAPATFVDRHSLRSPALVFASALLVAMTVYGAARLARGETTFVAGVRLRLMQPNLLQDQQFRPENGQEILRRYLALSDQATGPTHTGVADATHLIWPESAFPFVLSREPQALAAISGALQGKTLLTGGARAEEDRGRSKIYNAILVVQGDRIVASYDKKHLVPFGEYLPLDWLLRPLGARHLVPQAWEVGDRPRTLGAPGLPLATPLVCYEAIFSGDVVEPGASRPQWLLNVTNDGWFGKTSGPYQHFAQARLRAIEEGLPLVRAANSGVSAVVDPYGRVIEQLPVGVAGVIDQGLPNPASETLFSRHARIIFPLLWSGLSFLAFAGKWRPQFRIIPL